MARIAFTTFASSSAPAVQRWKEREADLSAAIPQPDHVVRLAALVGRHRPAPVLRRPSPPTNQPLVRRLGDFGECTGWRIISGNHREIARGVGLFPDYKSAAEQALRIRENAQSLTLSFVRHHATGRLGWYACFEDRPVLMAPAWHPLARECDQSAANALAALSVATVADKAVRHGSRYMPGLIPSADEEAGGETDREAPAP
ncbi:hypothetical protein [Sinomonas halotolerans]|uniref:Uncharacterized protein n=1 Tax=Sinomonas halotolerans TaxID=1644133 RepID=A0ABU9X0B5_9MICC